MESSTKVAVFGGTGFIGSYILESLVQNGFQVATLVRNNSVPKLALLKDIKIINGELNSKHSIQQTIQNCDVIVYAIGIIRENKKRGITFDKLHFEYFKKIVDISKGNGIKKIIYVSAKGVKDIGTKYQTSKYQAEQYLTDNFDNWTIFRPSVVYGDPKGKMEFMTQLKEEIIEKPFPAPLFFKTNPLKTDQFFKSNPIHVEDLTRLIVKSINSEYSKKKIHEVGGLIQMSWKGMLKSISLLLNKKKLFFPVPISIVYLITKLFDNFQSFPITSSQIKMLMEDNTCDSEELFEQYGITPIEFSKESIQYLVKK